MADTAFQIQYRDEFIAGFEKRQSMLRNTVTTEANFKGNQATFLVADSGGATAVTRGVNGDIPTRPDNNTQTTVTLQEWHDVPEKTNFNIMSSQGNQRQIMQMTSMAVINRKIDSEIHTALASASLTQDFTDGTPSLTTFFQDIRETIKQLREGSVRGRGQFFAAITPGFHANLMGLDRFTSRDYIQDPKFEGASLDDAFSWNGVNWLVDEELPGVGTATASCFLYHRDAVGHACHMDEIETEVGYDRKNAKSWQRCSIHMAAKIIQSSGVIKMTHDDTSIL